MTRALVVGGVFLVLGMVSGFLVAKLTTEVVPTISEQRAHGPTREVSADWRFDKFSPGHSLHVINRALQCNDCHDAARADFKEVDIGVCTNCHLEQTSHPHLDEQGQITECLTCHSFKFGAEPGSPWDCVRCHGPFNTPTHTGLAMHDQIACASCHHPHEPIGETAADCADCHESIKVRHGKPELSGTCADCHGGHKLAAEAQACMECHANEEPKVSSKAVFAGGHDACVDCHEPHAFSAASALQCGSCHRRKPVFAQATAREHRDCSSCHEPHAVRAAGDRSCKGCHEEVVSTHVAEGESECISCHEPHPKRRAQLALQCSSCHEEASSERAFHAPKSVCTDCHTPHGFDLSGAQEPAFCADCHRKQVQLSKQVPDHASCADCHEGTVHALEGPVACASCHEELEQASPEGHRECASCHEPHGGAMLAASCTSCHENASLPGLHRIPGDPQNTGHSDCATCHNAHNTQVRADRAACMECHDDIANHEPEAEVCTGCHTFISGKPRSPLTPRARERR